MRVLESILNEESYEPYPYQDSKGVWSIGHGLTYLDEDESTIVVQIRIGKISKAIGHTISHLSTTRQEVLIEMAYQLGVRGLFGFTRMWAAIRVNDCEGTVREMLDSQWAKEDSPNRANRLAIRFYDNE